MTYAFLDIWIVKKNVINIIFLYYRNHLEDFHSSLYSYSQFIHIFVDNIGENENKNI